MKIVSQNGDFGLLLQLISKQRIGFFCEVSVAKRNGRRLFIVRLSWSSLPLTRQTRRTFREVGTGSARFQKTYYSRQKNQESSELVDKLQLENVVTIRGDGPVKMVWQEKPYPERKPRVIGRICRQEPSCYTHGNVTEGLKATMPARKFLFYQHMK